MRGCLHAPAALPPVLIGYEEIWVSEPLWMWYEKKNFFHCWESNPGHYTMKIYGWLIKVSVRSVNSDSRPSGGEAVTPRTWQRTVLQADNSILQTNLFWIFTVIRMKREKSPQSLVVSSACTIVRRRYPWGFKLSCTTRQNIHKRHTQRRHNNRSSVPASFNRTRSLCSASPQGEHNKSFLQPGMQLRLISESGNLKSLGNFFRSPIALWVESLAAALGITCLNIGSTRKFLVVFFGVRMGTVCW